MKLNLIAPCGMNCGICLGYLRTKNRCNGCRVNADEYSNYCRKCIIKNCDVLKILNSLPFPAISQSEQIEIVNYLDCMQDKVERLELLQAKTTDELDALLPSILDRALKGDL